MSKKQTGRVDETEMTDATPETPEVEARAGQDTGVRPSDVVFGKVDPSENIPHFIPAQNWAVGEVLTGRYLRTERRVSTKEKKPNWKSTLNSQKQNEVYRDAFIMEDMTNGSTFAIWSVGTLNNFFQQVPAGAPVAITYTGLGEPFKAGQSKPHMFDYELGQGFTLRPRSANNAQNSATPN